MTEDRKYYQQVSDIVDRTRASVPSGGGGSIRWLRSENIKRALRIAILSLCVLLPVAYAADYAVFEFRILTHRNPFGVVQIESFYAIGEKGGKTEFDYGGAQNQQCVQSLFPHGGYSPCWYLKRHKEKRINL